MCRLCRQTPCHPHCPNYEPRAVYTCDQCEGPIYEGDTFYDFDDVCVCEECKYDWLEKHKRTAEVG